ncbi:DUF4097 family beta strand repeat protein [Thalassotalea sp. LPB0316]|uniref:DUF4097 family beta strand repeat-containing protein n=1 Tax=Thalassotalea sp. LPB0316 TaxID=2769490 RepID=UPI0018682B01|nr:DUF4097 family beta strand repeat-containing protein [Thalassotalea sp. LPB0316]QOL25989.1 DUF4097 family beta strand repeat protein [Thalassotalea sp. LPB0316]
MNILKHCLVLLASTSFLVFAGENIDQSLPADGVKSVEIENLRGKVKIIGQNTKAIRVVGQLDEEAEGFTFKQSGSIVLIKVEMPRHLESSWSRKETNLEISLPSALNVSFSGVSTDVVIKDIDADVNANSVSGNVNLENISQRVEVTSVSGDISAKQLGKSSHLSNVSGNIVTSGASGNLYAKAVSGDLNITSTASHVEVKNVSGEIELVLASVEELSMSTVSGDVDADLTLLDNGKVKLSSVSGDFTLNFLNDVDAIFRLRASAGGDLINRLTNDKAIEDKYGPSSRLAFETGNASARVNGSTVSGNVVLKRK